MALNPVPTGSTVDAVLDQLQSEITGGGWQVGERLPGEHRLADELGVSRPAVREAIRALTHIGVLEVRRGDGTYVRSRVDPRPMLTGVARSTLIDVFEVQLAYDVQAARLAARRRTADDLARLEDLLAARGAAADEREFGEADARFHLGVVEAGKNPLLVEAYRYFAGRLGEAIAALRADVAVAEAPQEAHRAVLDAVAARDPEAAERAARTIIEPTLATLDALVGRPTPQEPQ
ncbi:FadR family transcriptional regulator [Actinomadura logoneensis]|uniref:FadR family transcriptional regulator n=1 Tax=Actinomadura logoneensis TaxID=2293572 RepID=A0A372JC51_9ACTN|nr:FadR/GntR family transcriptional regulator [Actinomadura logoneensis]RFU37587.1 FadR family transcriptional regulator [Actinomadura logoneensis]